MGSAVALAGIVAALAGCGQRAPLVLPGPSGANLPQAAAPAASQPSPTGER